MCIPAGREKFAHESQHQRLTRLLIIFIFQGNVRACLILGDAMDDVPKIDC